MERSADRMDQAHADLVHARQDLRTEFYEWVCFSAQQRHDFRRWMMIVWNVAFRLSGLTTKPTANGQEPAAQIIVRDDDDVRGGSNQ